MFALIGFAAAAQLPDSATQGPNPQDIATPEPEYIDIDLPEPSRPAAPAPKPVVQPPRVVPRPVIAAPLVSAPPAAVPVQLAHNYAPAHHHVPGHLYNRDSGYQYRRPVYVRRYYRRRF